MSAIGKLASGLAPRSRSENGFTLIEALVTVAISALIAGIAFPSVEKAFGFWRFAQASSAVTVALEEARATALRMGQPVRFAVGADGRSYASGGMPLVSLPDGVRFEGNPVAVQFFADGSAVGGRLRLVGDRRARMFDIASDTGLLDMGS